MPRSGACGCLQLEPRRHRRWARRVAAGEDLADSRPGGSPSHGLTPSEKAEILAVFEEWGHVDRSHRKLAHRGSWLGRFWCDPSTAKRVLDAGGLRFRAQPKRTRTEKRPWPHWVEPAPNRVWIYDTTHWPAAGAATTVICDVVSRKPIADITSADETSTETEAVFSRALRTEGIDAAIAQRNPDGIRCTADLEHDGHTPVLLVLSDNGPQMTSHTTRDFMAYAWLAAHYGRPGTPTDQAWIESLFGHVKHEHPHLERISDIAVLRAELDTVAHHYNEVRLHAGIGYVTPGQQHRGEGETVRQARHDGLEHARRQRIAYHQTQPQTVPPAAS